MFWLHKIWNLYVTISRPLLGVAAIAEAVTFNFTFARLATLFEYPDILRFPAAQVLERFAQGGNALILTWYTFALSALALIPLGLALALAGRKPGAMAISAAMLAALAGLAQAIGLMRWVFVIRSVRVIPARRQTQPSRCSIITVALPSANILGSC